MPAIELSHFQREKLEYYFNFYEPNKDGCLDKTSLQRFMERVLAFTSWERHGRKARECEELHEAFFEILFEKSKVKGGHGDTVNLSEWLCLWSDILPGCMGIQNFPIWLRLLPKTLFQMIDRNNDNIVEPGELLVFYKDMVQIPADEAESRAKNAFQQMTDGGRYPLNLSSYEMIFSNFLIGKTPFGPGRHIFGCFEHADHEEEFKLIKSAEDVPSNSSQVNGKPTVQWRKPKRQNSLVKIVP